MIKGGFIAWAQMGDPNASIPTPQPVRACGRCSARSAARSAATSLAFVSQRALDGGPRPRARPDASGSSAVRRCRGIGKRDMKLNDALPAITVDPETYEVRADGELLRLRRRRRGLPLARRYSLF